MKQGSHDQTKGRRVIGLRKRKKQIKENEVYVHVLWTECYRYTYSKDAIRGLYLVQISGLCIHMGNI